MTIQAIETEYNGVRFRSRTEARWAIWFDTMGVRWEYEPEAFVVARGGYLPDFHLWAPHHLEGTATQTSVYAEIKKPRGFGKDERALMCEFAAKTTSAVLMLDGQPHYGMPTLQRIVAMALPDGDNGKILERVEMIVCPACRSLQLFNVAGLDHSALRLSDEDGWSIHPGTALSVCEHYQDLNTNDVTMDEVQKELDAWQKIRARRFWDPK